MNHQIRVRFAPSPTGFLHIGGARTALFNWLFARHYNGIFVLRIEDTDRTRSTDEYMNLIIEDMKWLGLDWDEGPFRQTDRFHIYKDYAERLIKECRAYYCTCTPEELERKRQIAIASGLPMKYDGKCRDTHKAPNAPAAIRFKMPEQGQTIVDDLIKGDIVFENSQLEDLVIVRSDGTPTYNFVVVVDDIDMKISHIIRGDDHLNNTPKQIHIYEALSSKKPEFAHLPMILGHDKSRLSKRHGATSVTAYKEMGYLPEAIVNYLARLGWSHGDQEVFTKDELINFFTLENVGKSAAVFNPEKLLWLNSQYIIKSESGRLAELIIPFLIEKGLIKSDKDIDSKWLSKAISLLKERAKTLDELANSLRYFVSDSVEIDLKAAQKFLTSQSIKYLMEIKNALSNLEDFSSVRIEEIFNALAGSYNVKLGTIAQPVRVAITGGTASPGIYELIEIIGKEKTINRLSRAIEQKIT